MDPAKIAITAVPVDPAAGEHALGQAHFTVGLPAVTLVQQPPLPALCTERNCGVLGLSPRALRKLAKSGLRHIRTPDGVTVLTDDLRAFCAQRATSTSVDAGSAPMSVYDEDSGDDLDQLAIAAGARRGSRK